MRIWMLVPDGRLAELIAAALLDAGHDVRPVPSISELCRAAPLATDLVLVDLPFAATGAISTMSALRGLQPCPRVLALGDRFLLHDRVVAAERGVEAYLPKPFGVDELLGTVSFVASAADGRH
jgi:DNA-binding response OmpR family regulator